MKYEVRCECGTAHSVSGADAGATLPCECGRSVEVPPLHELRIGAGQDVLTPFIRLQAMQLEGKLPGTRDCALCHRGTDGVVHIAVECERAIVKSSGPTRADMIGGCILSLPFGLFLHLLRRNAPTIQHGQDQVLTLPVPVCDPCQMTLNNPAILRQALRHIPDYSALLDHYPNARIARRG